MIRALLVCVVVAALAGPARAGAPAPPRTTVEKFAISDVVITGKVVRIEKDTVEATEPYAGSKQKVKYRVAVVKIDTGFFGAEKLKEIRIGFIPPEKPKPGERRPPPYEVIPELKEGEEWLFFLAKHPSADLYVMPWLTRPVELKGDQGKPDIEVVKKFAAVLADPVKALKSDKAEARAEAAALLVVKYRSGKALPTYPVEQVAIPAEENKLILKALSEGDWSMNAPRADYRSPLPLLAFYQLRLTEKDGWVAPVVVPPPPGVPAPDYGVILRDAFAKWRDGPGKDYVIKKLVSKKK
jgi:hypothetical protein